MNAKTSRKKHASANSQPQDSAGQDACYLESIGLECVWIHPDLVGARRSPERAALLLIDPAACTSAVVAFGSAEEIATGNMPASGIKEFRPLAAIEDEDDDDEDEDLDDEDDLEDEDDEDEDEELDEDEVYDDDDDEEEDEEGEVSSSRFSGGRVELIPQAA